MEYISVLLVVVYICIALRLYSTYLTQCIAAIDMYATKNQITRALIALLWLPILVLTILALMVAILIIAFTETDIGNMLNKYTQRK